MTKSIQTGITDSYPVVNFRTHDGKLFLTRCLASNELGKLAANTLLKELK